MQGYSNVVERTEVSYSEDYIEDMLSRIKNYYKSDLLEYKLYGPTGIVDEFVKNPHYRGVNYGNQED